MVKYEYVLKGDFNLEKIWELYIDVSSWSTWDKDLTSAELSGEFVNGSKGRLLLKNNESVDFILQDIKYKASFTSVTNLNGINICFEHMASNDMIKHSVLLEGADENVLQGIGKNLLESLERSVKSLGKIVSNEKI